MLKTKPLNQLLSQSISPNVSSALLFTPSGALLATATSPVAPDAKKSRTHAALAANIWSNYERVAAQGLIEQSLPAPASQAGSTNPAPNGSKPADPPLKSLTLELSDYNLHVQLVAPKVLLCLIGPKQATRQPSSNSSLHSNDGDQVFEGPGSFKSGVLGGIRSGGATPAGGSLRGTGTTAVGSVSSVTAGSSGSLGILKAQAQALVDYLEKELKGFELPEGI
ncbi:hypothetical protein BDZ91DRAFT_729718 [Kalaharituber pfeilii]|nr:hypothetical protein BDZ91DRAFT_729718 [Kalaharituber pfeilii]